MNAINKTKCVSFCELFIMLSIQTECTCLRNPERDHTSASLGHTASNNWMSDS